MDGTARDVTLVSLLSAAEDACVGAVISGTLDPMTAEPSASGRCLCGAVSYEVAGPLRTVIDCHCERCRRFTGHYLAATSAPAEKVAITDPTQQLGWYAVPGAEYGFCRGCGGSLFWRAESSPEDLSITAGTLEPPTGLHTTLALWVSQASDYLTRPAVPELDTE